MLRIAAFITLLFALVQPAGAFEWRRFSDRELGFSLALPIDLFVQRSVEGSSMHLSDATGDVVLDVYSAENTERLRPSALADELTSSDRIDEVTYRRVGRRWFVLSGYYAREGYEAQDLIFYTKFMFSSDRSQFAAFEISYPVELKRELEPVVEKIEDTFRPRF